MQRRPKTSSRPNGSPATSALPRYHQHPPVANPPTLRRFHSHPTGIHRNNKNSSIIKNALQLFIAVCFGFTCMVFYKSIHNSGSGGSNNVHFQEEIGKGPSWRNYQSVTVSKDNGFNHQHDLSSSEGVLHKVSEYHSQQQQGQRLEKSSKTNSNENSAKAGRQELFKEDTQLQQNEASQYNIGEYNQNKKQSASRTTEEANAYMNSQPNSSVRGEQILKQKLMNLYELQQKSDLEDMSPIVTRYLGTEDIPHWLPKSSTTDEIIKQWKEKVEKAKDEMRKLDRQLFPELYEIPRQDSIKNGSIHSNRHDGNGDNTSFNGNTHVMIYPSPAKDGSHPMIEPTFGQHRSHVDAIFALAEGYDLKIYVLFIESLKETGFHGDLVLSVSAIDQLKPGVEEYLRSYVKEEGEDGLNVVAYTVSWTCYEKDGVTEAKGANEGVRKCQLNGMYGDENNEPVEDPYEPRPVATARYELYWAWSLKYDEHSWLMLIDSRDAYFQLNPFANLERNIDDGSDKSDGVLYLFEENAEASTIGQSPFNSRWLKEAYGQSAVEPYFDKPIICSGSTMGEKVAIESYLRGMVAQFEKTKCKSKGCDQGFHNYLYYSGGLQNVQGIREVKVFEQGKGIINNLGVLRSKPLKERGLLDDEMRVLNWDKSISAVAHQWDRDEELNNHLKGVRKSFDERLRRKSFDERLRNIRDMKSQSELKMEHRPAIGLEMNLIYPSPAKDGAHPMIEPTFGQHRSHVDAIFALAEGYDLKIYVLFIESLKETGFHGDLVLSVSAIDQLKPGVEEYLRSYVKEEGEDGLNVVAYTVSWTCYEKDGVTEAKGANEGVRKCQLNGMYGDENNEPVEDPYEPRPVATARYELYWAWSLKYDEHSWLMLIDSRDAYFQLNPFANLERNIDDGSDKSDGVLYLFEENAEASTIGQSPFNSRWLKEAYGQSAVEPFFDKPIICSGSTMGEKVAIESYLRGMVAQFEKTKCKSKGCDQGFHNYLYYSGGLQNVQGIREVKVFEQGKGIINNLGVLRSKPLKERGLLDDEMRVLNWDKSISAVAHQWDRDDELNKHVKGKRLQFMKYLHTK